MRLSALNISPSSQTFIIRRIAGKLCFNAMGGNKINKLSRGHCSSSRRQLIKNISLSSGVVAASTFIPKTWTKPIIETVFLPVHAVTSTMPLDPDTMPLCDDALTLPDIIFPVVCPTEPFGRTFYILECF